MNIQRAFSIKGVGSYLPKNRISSSEIEKELDLPENWIFDNIGVKFRYIASDESNTFMGVEALRNALEDANMGIENIDCILGASATFDHVIPNRATLIKNGFEEANNLDFPCLDINTVCTSFISALDYASMLLSSGDYENIAIVSSEISSKGLNPKDVETYSLFGDAAAAVIVSRSGGETGGLIRHSSKTYSKGAKYTMIKGGGNMYHPKDFSYDPDLYSFKMDGIKLLKSVKSTLPIFLKEFNEKSPVSLLDVDLIVPHQASKLGLRMLSSLHKENTSKIVNQLEDYGNCIAASIPLSLVNSIKQKRLREGDTCFLLGTAAGITISGLLFQYSSI